MAAENTFKNLDNLREKKKWQIALRRYVIDLNYSSFYAPYFGLDNKQFRRWIEIQFNKDLSWNNFGKAWQLEHIIPVVYFDLAKEEELLLCWNFTNIRVDKTMDSKDRRVDVLTAKAYFEYLYHHTAYRVCEKMVMKINALELLQVDRINTQKSFLQENLNYLETLSTLTSYEFNQINAGTDLPNVLAERKMLGKFS